MKSEEPQVPSADDKLMARANALVHALVEAKAETVTLGVTNGEKEYVVSVRLLIGLEADVKKRADMQGALEELAFLGDRCDVKFVANRGLGRTP